MKFVSVQNHFHRVDPIIAAVLDQMQERILMPSADASQYFSKVCLEIISQQLSTKVATVISQRFVALFPDARPTSEAVLVLSETELRSVGLSGAKIKYIKDLAAKTISTEVKWSQLAELDNEDVIAELTKVKGIGRWTAEMFLIFTLGREDVFSDGDLGLKKALINLYNLDEHIDKKTYLEKTVAITAAWAPYRSYGSLALWWSLDNKFYPEMKNSQMIK